MVSPAGAPGAHLVISEFMADNETVLADEDGDFSGWIEIYNPTPSAIDLAGHFLTDDAADPTRWEFPSLTLASGQYLVVFASGKDRRDPANPLHTNFRLRNAGEYLALNGPGPILLHAYAPAFPPQRPDISYGVLETDLNSARYFGVPTPGAPNDPASAPPEPVQLSRASATFTEPFTLTLTNITPGARIRYTLDGSAPNATNGLEYQRPILISTTTRVRAVAVGPDGQASRVTGAAFIKLGATLLNYTSPVPMLVIENFGAGTIPQKGWSSTGAGIKQVPRQDAFWATFDCSSSYSALTNPPQMISRIGIRGRGAYSTQWRQKPYSVEARDEAGEELEVSPLGMPPHADWVMYFPDPDQNKDPALLFNTFAYELSRRMGQYAVRFRWVEVFVNEDGGDLSLADRRGMYALIEKVSRGKYRLDFDKLSEDGTRGGWLLSLNRMDPEPETGWPAPNGATQPWFFHTAGPNRIQETPPNTPGRGDDIPRQSNGFLNFDNPNGYVINLAQRAAIEGWFKQFEDVLYNDGIWRDPELGYRRYIDAVEFADYFILNVLTRNGDGLLISLFPWKGNDNKLRIGPAWDYNWNAYYVSGGPTGSLMHRSDRLWYARLFTDPDFLQLYIDRWWTHRLGPMSNEGIDAIIDEQVAAITPDKALLNGMPSRQEWANRITRMKDWLKDRADWIDSHYLRPPVFNQNGGPVADGFQVVIIATNGTIYYTTDGSDPRAPGGLVAPTARNYDGAFPIHAQTMVKARVRKGTQWSGLASAVFYPPQDLSMLAVTEIMYHPPDQGPWSSDDLEFIELKNLGAEPLRLGGFAFTSGIRFTFPPGTELAPGQFFVLGRNAPALQGKYPELRVDGIYSGKLANGGEELRLTTPFGSTILSITYNDSAPWPIAADGFGFSIVPRDAATVPNSSVGGQWRASTTVGGSPGADDPMPSIPPVVINEVLSNPIGTGVDAVELFNPTGADADISGWFLSDDRTVPKKFRIPLGTILPAGGYRVFTEHDFNPVPATLLNFAFNSAGDSVYLTSADLTGHLTGYSHGFAFDAAAQGVSFGRYVNSQGQEFFPAQSVVTLGAANAGPVVGPVIIQEIMYHPEADGEEFIELKNISASEVALFDPAHATNTWRVEGLAFDFPPGLRLAADGLILVVPTNPEAFRAKYGVPGEVLIVGPFAGALQNGGERLAVQRPGPPESGGVPYITVDEVRCDDKAPWPPAADGGGPSLQRRSPTAYGNEPTNWLAAIATPGRDFVPGEPPVIIEPPRSRRAVAYQDVVFHVEATGATPLFYQWLFNGVPLAATNDTLRLTNVQPAQAGRYQVVVFNAAGSVISDTAELSLVLPAVILKQPEDQSVAAGQTATFSVEAAGSGQLRYQWRHDGMPLPGATSSTLTIANAQPADAGVYDVVVTDDVGPVLSEPAQLRILIQPVIVQHPLSQSVVSNASVTLSVSVTNMATLPIGYRWRRGGLTLTLIITNAYTNFFTISNIQETATFTVVVTNEARQLGFLSQRATITVLSDADGDGLPDEWEVLYGLDPGNTLDAALDADDDSMTNWEEYVAGTDPTNALSYLKVEAQAASDGARLTFMALSNKTYTVQYTDALGKQPWATLTDVLARATNRVATIRDPRASPHRYYRLVTPKQ